MDVKEASQIPWKSNYKGTKKYFPRVLIIGTPMSQVSGGPITISNLFHDWPFDKLAVAYLGLYENDPQRRDRDFVLHRELALPGMKRGIEWKTSDELLRAAGKAKRVEYTGANKPYLHRIGARIILERLGTLPLMQRYPLTNELSEFVSFFRPEIIYTHLGDIPISSLVLELSKTFHLPVIVHIMDDFASAIYRTGLFSAFARKKMDRQLREIFATATIRMGICQAMCDEYSRRYGASFVPFHNPVDLSIWSKEYCEAAKEDKFGEIFRIVYSGRIGIASESSIKDVCDLLRNWDQPDISLTFDIYVNDLSRVMETACFLKNLPPNVRIQQTPKDPDKIAEILASADILLLPVDFDQESLRYIRFSMPTKIPAYMASGRPILVYGPAEVASVRYARESGWGYVVDKRSPELLKEAIVRLCRDQDLRQRLFQTAKQVAALNHEASGIRESFRSVIAQAVGK